MKRELQHKDIAGYIPYEINCIHDNKVKSIIYIEFLPGCDATLFDGDKYTSAYLEDIKLILRPIEDLSDRIIVEGYNEGKPFTPLIEIAYACYPNMVGWRIDDEGNAYTRYNGRPHWVSPEDIELATFEVFDLLNQWHFDYRGLIEKGLAVDINTIEV